jgi:hypothetical protein
MCGVYIQPTFLSPPPPGQPTHPPTHILCDLSRPFSYFHVCRHGGGPAITNTVSEEEPSQIFSSFLSLFQKKHFGMFSSLSFLNWGRKETVAGFRIGNDDDGLGERRAHLNR